MGSLRAHFFTGALKPSGARPWSRNQLETVVGGPHLRTAARMAACSAFVSFSVTRCVRAAAPSGGRPILRFGLRRTLMARRFIVRGTSRTSGYCIPESRGGQFGLTLRRGAASITTIVDLSTGFERRTYDVHRDERF